MSVCRVACCRHPHTHTTAGHRCGRCHQFGHGQVECTRSPLIARLARLYGDEALPEPDRCPVAGCFAPHTHTADAHYCHVCQGRGRQCACPPPPAVVRCPQCKTDNPLPTETVFTGADCSVCFEAGRMSVLSLCRHATVCPACAVRLASLAGGEENGMLG